MFALALSAGQPNPTTGPTTGPATAPTAGPAARVRAIATDIALNVAAPYLLFAALRQAGATESQALLLSTAAPVVVAITSLIRRRRIDGLSILVIATTLLSLLASYLSGSPWFALIRPSFITGSIAILFLASLRAPRPILFYLARDTTCATPEAAAAFETNWSRPSFRAAMRRLTFVWAAFLGGEAIFRAALAAIWPNPDLIAATQILWFVLPILLVRWSITAGRRWWGAPT